MLDNVNAEKYVMQDSKQPQIENHIERFTARKDRKITQSEPMQLQVKH